jgi:hypothetical protein
MQHSRLKLSKIKFHLCQSHGSYFSKLYVDTNSEIKIARPLSQATAYNHPNIFTCPLLLSEGRTCEAWEPSNKQYSFSLPTVNCLSYFPERFTFICSSTILSTRFCVYPSYRCEQRLGKHVLSATNTHAAIEKLLDASFYVRSVSHNRKVGD